ncbi:tetratricopeptide repeat protein [Reticulibacter mediterranei]|uniref:Tetratricopeptide repeat protein n=1 Tax=Reticulibacter mediterranei TaxID=2778369 RepID=A0A8J3IJ33_9CHLR|nr:FxSxx-COOH system tetratricopeptide repeat protein [Reticulibacter mediterranei]GHO96449.1 tetratricopeptide repeat protein [Reticulibacter mediterranei]
MPRNESLRKLRIERNWRQKDVADQLGTTITTIGRWERGDQQPGAYFRVKLCTLFGKSAQELGLVEEFLSPPESNITDAAQAVSAPSEERALWTVPYARNPHFTGRDDLLSQLEQLFAEKTPDQPRSVRQAALIQTQAMTGLGGIGKTQIAIEYAYRARAQRRYRDILWISAASAETIVTSFVELARLLPTLVSQEETNQHTIIAAILRWLEQREQPWLLLVDNADDLSLIQPYLPRQGNGHILLTTRAHAVGALASSLEVDTMGIMEGTHLLLRRAHRFSASSPDEIDEAINVVIALGQFPLAIDQAGAYIEETGCSLHDYLHIYQQHRSALLARRGKQTTPYPESVATTWSLSFEQVERSNPAAAELLRLCAFLAPDHIPEELLTEGASHWPPALGDAVTNLLSFNQMLETLLAFSLVKRLSEERMLSIHRLVQAVQMDRMETQTQRAWSEQVVRAVQTIFPQDPKNVDTWPQCLRYLEQVEACDTLIRDHQFLLPEGADLLDRTGSYFLEHSMLTQAAPLYRHALAIREQRFGLEHPQTAASLNHLAIFHRDNGSYKEAEPLYLRALRIREQHLGPHHLDTADSLDSLANLYESQRDYAKAEPLYLRALRIREQHLGPHHPDTALTLHHMAILYQDQGKYGQAETLGLRALRIQEQHLGPHHSDTINSLGWLGVIYQAQGKYAEAERIYLRTIEIQKQQFGSSHFYTATCLRALAELYMEQGRYREAEPLCLRARDIYEQHLGPLHAHMADVLVCQAILFLKQGKHAQAEALALRALGIHEEHLGTHHPYASLDLVILATLYRDQGNYAQAEPLFLRALSINEQAFVSTHPQAAQACYEFALLRQAQGHDDEARSLYERALAARTHTFGATHPQTIEARERLMALLRSMGSTQEAAPLEGTQPETMNPLRESAFTSSREGSTEHISVVASVTGDVLPACPQCQQTTEIIKSGKNRSGSQRFRCRACQLYFTPGPRVRHPDQSRKAEALALAEQGMSYRRIASLLGVHHQTVSTWVSSPSPQKAE